MVLNFQLGGTNMTKEESRVVNIAAEWLYLNLNLSERLKKAWVEEFVDYMDITLAAEE